MPHSSPGLARLAMTVLQPGFDGTAPPGWLRRALGQGLGGAVLFARNLTGPAQTAELVAGLRSENPAVVVAVDEEGGTVTRLEARTGSSFPGNRALGVAGDPGRTERVARAIGRLLAGADITLDYAPVADVNANPANPVIGVRSFGPEPGLVARHTAAWVRGLQSAGVAACAKHFPGHGDTVTDSHLALPTVHAPLGLLRERDLPPFRAAIEAGVRAVMCGHLLVPALDPAVPATLSRRVLTGLLREELGFEGVLVTDAIEMRAVAALHPPGEIAVRALAAGADAVCAGVSSPGGESVLALRDAIVEAVHDGRLAEERLAEAASRVLALAAWHAARADARRAAVQEAGVRETAPLPRAEAIVPGAGPVRDEDEELGMEAARAALRVVVADGRAQGPVLSGAPLVVDIAPRLNMAVDPSTPTGLLGALGELLPGTAGRTVVSGTPGLPELPDDRQVVLVVHDAGRHSRARELLAQAVRRRPDAIVVETGIPDEPIGAVYVATHGISRASSRVVARWLTGDK
ncbi:glycoside hydrolase family 3 protein [Planobispora takensis]|uniref:Hydrolase n=1 Tax=Planobispora takensis TaxID=1367882 RepID=A0A8J3WTY6_9ACTN|nr:glycoside hydrolase family 3 N-terminal domain-containing protein [Planobispora takensis]GII02066.1 hydrolase [Planobispora takensis]